MKYNYRIYEALANYNHSESQVDEMDPQDVLTEYLSWEGIMGFDDEFMSIMEAYKNTTKNEIKVRKQCGRYVSRPDGGWKDFWLFAAEDGLHEKKDYDRYEQNAEILGTIEPAESTTTNGVETIDRWIGKVFYVRTGEDIIFESNDLYKTYEWVKKTSEALNEEGCL